MFKSGDWVRTLNGKIMFEVANVGEDYVLMDNGTYVAEDYVMMDEGTCIPFAEVELIYNPETFAQSNVRYEVAK